MFETLPASRSKKDLALVVVLVVALGAFAARLVSGPSQPNAPRDERASIETAPARS